jgi:hypothetical protein
MSEKLTHADKHLEQFSPYRPTRRRVDAHPADRLRVRRDLYIDALHWESGRVIQTWNCALASEVFHEFSKQVCGLESAFGLSSSPLSNYPPSMAAIGRTFFAGIVKRSCTTAPTISPLPATLKSA